MNAQTSFAPTAPARTPTPDATITFEIEIALSGSIDPGAAPSGPTYSCGGTPGYGPCVEDVAVLDVGLIQATRGLARTIWTTTSLLDGIDRNSPEIQKLFANILKLKQDEAEEAILSEAGE